MNKTATTDIVFGTSLLGNLYQSLSDETKCSIVRECFMHSGRPVFFDTAGKYGAGLALESLGKCLRQLEISQNDVTISNKLGWLRTELKTKEPQFEPGVWKDLKYDAIQQISYQGILECYHQGNELLNGYSANLVSVHDPDEYIAGSEGATLNKKYNDILEAYRALFELKQQGKVTSVGVGAKDWRIIKRVYDDVRLDWVMIANSMTVHSHPDELISFMERLQADNVTIINSAVFNGGFLVGSDYYNYRLTSPETDQKLYQWRSDFFAICEQYNKEPAYVCTAFARKVPGVKAMALNTSNPVKVKKNVGMANAEMPDAFWKILIENGLINPGCKKFLLDN